MSSRFENPFIDELRWNLRWFGTLVDAPLMKLRPLGDRVIVRRTEAEGVSAGGIIIPDAAKETPVRGEVIAVGPGKTLEDGEVVVMALEVGDRILFSKYAGTEVKWNDETLLMMREEDVLAVIIE